MVRYKNLMLAMTGLTLVSTATSVHAEQSNGLTITPMVGFYMYDDALKFDQHEVLGGALGYQTSGALELGINYFTGSTVFSDTTFDTDVEQAYLSAAIHFQETQASHPYILIGAGRQTYALADNLGEYQDSILVGGAGYQIALSQNFSIRPDVRALYNLDEETTTTAFMVGFRWLLAGKEAPKAKAPVKPIIIDTDDDGVIDSQDQCPDTAMGTQVDQLGCAVDNDIDKDGVVNELDQCPGTSASAKVDAVGCYILITEAKEIQLYVTFEDGSSFVSASSYDEIRNVADFMQEYPLTRVLLAGHTDSSGSAAYNQRLSLQRADAVALLLAQHFGITPNRIETVGYGESRPIYPNDTAVNRAANRRVTATVTALVETIQK